MSEDASSQALGPVTSETRTIRLVLTALVLLFMALFLLLPLAAMFVEAFRKGLARLPGLPSGSGRARRHPPDADGGRDRGAAQPRLRHRGRLGDREVRVPRQEPAHHPDRPAVLGLAGGVGPRLRAAVRRPGAVRPLAPGAGHRDHLRPARHRPRDDLRHLPVRRPRADPADAGAGHGRRGGGADPRRLGAQGVPHRDAAERQLGAALRRPPVQCARHGRVRRRRGRLGPCSRAHQHHAAPRGDPLQ